MNILLFYLLFLSVLFLGVVSAECGDGACDANECKTAVSGKTECAQDCQYQCSDDCDNDNDDLIDYGSCESFDNSLPEDCKEKIIERTGSNTVSMTIPCDGNIQLRFEQDEVLVSLKRASGKAQ